MIAYATLSPALRREELVEEQRALLARDRELSRLIAEAVVADDPVGALRQEREAVRDRVEDIAGALLLLSAREAR